MISQLRWFSIPFVLALCISTVNAADTVSSGTVKSINAEGRTFVLTDSSNKDSTYKLGENVVINRLGKEGKSDLKQGDVIQVCFDKGLLTWTSHYILIQEGTSKNYTLVKGNIKSYDADNKSMIFTSEAKTDTTYPVGKANVRLNFEESKMADINIGDSALLIVEVVDGKSTLQSVMVDRVK